jgi:hypothetical protein
VIGAAYEHWWTPQVKTTILGSHAEISYNSNVVNNRAFCGGNISGFATVAQSVTVGAGQPCDPGFQYSDIRVSTSWYPVPGFRLAAEVGYVMIDSGFNGQVINLTKMTAPMLRPTGAYVANNQNLWLLAFRAQRGFGAVGGE